MSSFMKAASTALVTGLLVVALFGCEKGPAEKTGEKIDATVEKMGESLEKAGDDIQDAARSTGD